MEIKLNIKDGVSFLIFCKRFIIYITIPWVSESRKIVLVRVFPLMLF